MMRAMVRRALIPGIVALAALAPLPASAEAATLPAHAVVGAGRCVEPLAFRSAVASRYHVEFTRVIATDIDRDGDIDVVATTDRTFTVWLNDGEGHLTSQKPASGPAIDGRAPGTTWRGSEQRSDPSTNESAPQTPVLVARAHAPPSLALADAASADDSAHRLSLVRFSAPRAPPAA